MLGFGIVQLGISDATRFLGRTTDGISTNNNYCESAVRAALPSREADVVNLGRPSLTALNRKKNKNTEWKQNTSQEKYSIKNQEKLFIFNVSTLEMEICSDSVLLKLFCPLLNFWGTLGLYKTEENQIDLLQV